MTAKDIVKQLSKLGNEGYKAIIAFQKAPVIREKLAAAESGDVGCVSACNFDPLSWGIGVQH